jgi:lysylphosphatidylglycerol synthase-like protein
MVRLAFFVAGLLWLIYLILQLGPQNIFSIILSLKWNLLGVTLIYGASEMIRAVALWNSLPEGESQSYLRMLGVRLSGEAIRNLTFTGPFVGEPLKAWLLRRTGLPAIGAVAAVITEYLVYTFASAAIGLAGLSYILSNIQLSKDIAVAAQIIAYVMAAFLATSAIAIIFRIYLIGAVIEGMRRLPSVRERMPWDRARVRQMEDLLFQVFREHPQRFATIFALDCAAHALLICELYWIVTSSRIPLGMFQAFLIEAATKFMALAFFFVPMQVGVAEKTYSVVFGILALPLTAAVAMSLVRRFRTIIVSAVGLTALVRMTNLHRS